MKITVTQDDIKKASPVDGYNCPVARALRRHLRRKLFVAPSGVYRGVYDGKPLIRLPQVARCFIDRFDMHNEVEPITFQIRRPTDQRARKKSKRVCKSK